MLSVPNLPTLDEESSEWKERDSLFTGVEDWLEAWRCKSGTRRGAVHREPAVISALSDL